MPKLGVAVHRMGVPEEDLLEEGRFLLLLIVERTQELEQWLAEPARTGPERPLDSACVCWSTVHVRRS